MITTYPNEDRKRILDKVSKFSSLLEQLPGVVVVNDIRDGSVIYMSEKGLRLLGITLAELQDMGATYHDKFFNAELANEHVPKILGLVERNDPSETLTFFQQVKFAHCDEWQWHLSALRIFVQDKDGKPLALLCISQHLSTEQHYAGKIQRLTNELTFLKENIKKFNALGKREKEILKLMAEGKSTPEIAKSLYLSTHTADTHRKNIRRKLGIDNSAQMLQFAHAFDLI